MADAADTFDRDGGTPTDSPDESLSNWRGDSSLEGNLPPTDPQAPMKAPPNDAAESADQAGADSSKVNTVIIRYGLMHSIGEFTHDLPKAPLPGSHAVIRTDRGVELGEILVSISGEPSWRCVSSPRLREYIHANGPEYPYHRGGKILRMANPQDIIDHRHLGTSAREEGTYARQQIRDLKLPMRLVTVEHLLGGERIIFYFCSEARVDFRELVRRLAAQFRTRIEMRQVGARDEARLVADYERCGQRCCCQQYLKDLKPVSMRMAKTQKATLDPTKISGRCGRLMCCLRYEDAGYEELRKKLPRRNIWVRTEKIVGRVVDSQIITQLVQLQLPDGTFTVVANEEILERDVPAPPVPTRPEPRHREERPEPRMLRDEGAAKAEFRQEPDKFRGRENGNAAATSTDSSGMPAAPVQSPTAASQSLSASTKPETTDVTPDAVQLTQGEEDVEEGFDDSGASGAAPTSAADGTPQAQPRSPQQPSRHGSQQGQQQNRQGGPQGGQGGQGQGQGRRRRRRHRGRRRGHGQSPGQGQGGTNPGH